MNDGIEIVLSDIDDKISTPILLASTSVNAIRRGIYYHVMMTHQLQYIPMKNRLLIHQSDAIISIKVN